MQVYCTYITRYNSIFIYMQVPTYFIQYNSWSSSSLYKSLNIARGQYYCIPVERHSVRYYIHAGRLMAIIFIFHYTYTYIYTIYIYKYTERFTKRSSGSPGQTLPFIRILQSFTYILYYPNLRPACFRIFCSFFLSNLNSVLVGCGDRNQFLKFIILHFNINNFKSMIFF